MGRPSKLTPAVSRCVLEVLERAGSRSLAARTAGVDPVSVHRWVAWGDEGREPFASFAVAVRCAEAKAEAAMLARVVQAGAEDWRASAWVLERRFRRSWSRRDLAAERAQAAAKRAAAAELQAVPLEALEAMVQAERERRNRAGG